MQLTSLREIFVHQSVTCQFVPHWCDYTPFPVHDRTVRQVIELDGRFLFSKKVVVFHNLPVEEKKLLKMYRRHYLMMIIYLLFISCLYI